MEDKDNQGRWAKPTQNDAPDKEVPGFLVNLGPTGARAILTDRTFVVRSVFANSPAYGRLKNAFKGIEGFDQKIKRFDEGLRKDPWKKEATLGKRYLYYLGGLQRFKSPTHLKALEKFAQANPDSIYGKWAGAVVEEFRAKGTISVSSDGKPGGPAPPDAPDAAPRRQ